MAGRAAARSSQLLVTILVGVIFHVDLPSGGEIHLRFDDAVDVVLRKTSEASTLVVGGLQTAP